MKSILFILLAFAGSFAGEINTETITANEVINFTFSNRSNQDIVVKLPGKDKTAIPGKSQMRVNLKQGSKIFFFHKNKKHLLMSVKKNHQGKTLFVDQLVNKKKIALKLK